MQSEVNKVYYYKPLIRRALRRLGVETDHDRFIHFLQKYSYGLRILIPPWAETDIAFYQENRTAFAAIQRELGDREIPARDSQVAWLPISEMALWARVVEGHGVPLQLYFTCNLRKRGTLSDEAELALLRKQCPAENLIYPGEFDQDALGIPYGEPRAEFCRDLILTHADVVIFSEFEAEYGRFIGFGVYSEVLEAQRKGIPVLLLRDGRFWLNPRIALHDAENLVCHAKVCATPYPPFQFLEDLFYFGDL